MSEKKEKPALKRFIIAFTVSFIAGIALFIFYLVSRDFPVAELKENYRILADAATVPGLLFVMFGALVWAAGKGAVDGVSFAMSRALQALIPGARANADETYADYLERRREKRKKSLGYSFLLLTGLGFMIVAVVFVVLFYNA
ncbi:MAG: DUF3899 domain-containing protein [Lachnospiraceae bacterium]|nr:DUF3899 domain-containing protein [Lachnospiraceae bacterium]